MRDKRPNYRGSLNDLMVAAIRRSLSVVERISPPPESSDRMPQGTVKILVMDRGYGFLARPDGEDVFFTTRPRWTRLQEAGRLTNRRFRSPAATPAPPRARAKSATFPTTPAEA